MQPDEPAIRCNCEIHLREMTAMRTKLPIAQTCGCPIIDPSQSIVGRALTTIELSWSRTAEQRHLDGIGRRFEVKIGRIAMKDRSMWGGGDYDLLMGRWSRILAPKFVQFADVRDGQHVLEVGCGTGSLTRALLETGPGVRVTGIDGSADYIAITRESIRDTRAKLEQGDAQALPYQDNSFDSTVSLLVMNFIPNAARAVTEMRRVTRTGGSIAAAVWDYGDGMEMLRHLWNEAAAIDDAAVSKHEGRMPLCRQGELVALWHECGLKSVTDTGLTIQMDFASFDDYWQPFLTGVGPSGSYVRNLDTAMQAKLRERLREKLTGGSDEIELRLRARAWAVRGMVDN